MFHLPVLSKFLHKFFRQYNPVAVRRLVVGLEWLPFGTKKDIAIMGIIVYIIQQVIHDKGSP